MTACTSPVSIARSTPLTISVPVSSSATCRFLISSNAMVESSLARASFETGRRPERPGRARTRYACRHAWIGSRAWEIAILLVIVLLVFGPKRLPEMGTSLGKGMREFKDSITGKDDDPPAELPSDLRAGRGNRLGLDEVRLVAR